MIRVWQTYTLSYYTFAYFTDAYNNDTLFATLNALAVILGGLTCSVVTGIICDKYEPINFRTKSYAIVIQSLIAIPTCAIAFLIHSSFALSISMIFLEYLLAEGWIPPTFSMILTSIDPKYKGQAVGIFAFSTTMSGTFVVWLDAKLISLMDSNGDSLFHIGTVITLTTSLPCLIAAICFWRAGIHYEQFKLDEEKKVDDALEKMEAYHV